MNVPNFVEISQVSSGDKVKIVGRLQTTYNTGRWLDNKGSDQKSLTQVCGLYIS